MGPGGCGRPASATPGRLAMLSAPGVYALLLILPYERATVVGKLGTFRFPAGYYLYLGSARGPGGLSGRLARHCQPGKRVHWHIDYLQPEALIEQMWALATTEPLECRWAAGALGLPGAAVPAPRFGASDCRCPAHLVHYPTRPAPAALAPSTNLAAFDCDATRPGNPANWK